MSKAKGLLATNKGGSGGLSIFWVLKGINLAWELDLGISHIPAVYAPSPTHRSFFGDKMNEFELGARLKGSVTYLLYAPSPRVARKSN